MKQKSSFRLFLWCNLDLYVKKPKEKKKENGRILGDELWNENANRFSYFDFRRDVFCVSDDL